MPTPPSHSEGTLSSTELARVRSRTAPARLIGDLVHRQSDRGVAGGDPAHAGRAAALLGADDQDGAESAGRLPAGVPADKGLVGSIISLLALDVVPNHSALSRRAKTLIATPAASSATGLLHLLVDSTGLKLGGPGKWLTEMHGTQRRRASRKLSVGIDAGGVAANDAAADFGFRFVDDAKPAGQHRAGQCGGRSGRCRRGSRTTG
jgi:Transposase DDE domain